MNSSRFGWLPWQCSLIAIFVAGCKGEVPVPAKPTTSARPEEHNATPVKDSSLSATALPGQETTSGTSTDERPVVVEEGFVPLSREQFDVFTVEPAKLEGTEEPVVLPVTWQATDDGLTCTGKPRGYLYSQESYENFTWRLEYRFPRPKSLKDDTKFKGNTGFLVYINGEQKLWPACIEVQGKFVQIAAIKENGGAEPVTVDDNDAARQEYRKPVGEWNALEITSKAGGLTVLLNGHQITASQAGPLIKGQIGIQAEDHPFEVRRMRIRID